MDKALIQIYSACINFYRIIFMRVTDEGADEILIAQQMGHSAITIAKEYYYYSNKTRKTNEAQIEKAISI